HDLVSPVGAVNNGIELIQELGEEVREEAMELIAGSALVAARRLSFYRMAFGMGSKRSQISVTDARQVATALFDHGRIELDWPRYLIIPFDGPALPKVLLNVLLFGEEIVQRGKIELASQEGRGRVTFRLMGSQPEISDQSRAAFDGLIEETQLNPHTVQAFITGLLLRQHGYFLTFDPVGVDRMDLHMGQR
ncbi:MAG: histidine phosphotransferase family protein, partial [Pseudomonadota bacterium]